VNPQIPPVLPVTMPVTSPKFAQFVIAAPFDSPQIPPTEFQPVIVPKLTQLFKDAAARTELGPDAYPLIPPATPKFVTLA